MKIEDALSAAEGTIGRIDLSNKIKLHCMIEGSLNYDTFVSDISNLKINILKTTHVLDMILNGEFNGNIKTENIVILVRDEKPIIKLSSKPKP